MVLIHALSLADQAEKYGAYLGIAAFFGLAVFTVLYFAQARELRRLREWAGRAPERAREVEERVVAQAQAARRGEPAQGEPAGAEAAPRAATAPAATAAGAAAAAGARGPATGPVTAGAAGTATAAPAPAPAPGAGVDQPTQASDAIADPEAGEDAPTGNGAGSDTEAQRATSAAASAQAPAGAKPPATEGAGAPATSPEPPATEGAGAPPTAPETPATAAGEPAAGPDAERQDTGETAADSGSAPSGSAPNGTAPPPSPAPGVPRATPAQSTRARPAPAAPLRSTAASASPAAQHRRAPAPATPGGRRPGPPTADASTGDGRSPVTIGLYALVAVLVAAAAVFGATRLLGGDDETPATSQTPQPTAQADGDGAAGTGGTASRRSAGARPDRAATQVAVLNGTVVGGLARTTADKIRNRGYEQDVNTGNFTDQGRSASVIYYARGAEAEGRDIGRALKISDRQPMNADTQTLGGGADVIVVVGSDQNP